MIIDREKIENYSLPEHINAMPRDEFYLTGFACNKCYQSTFLKKKRLHFDPNKRVWEDNPFVVSVLTNASSVSLLDQALYITGGDGREDHLSANITPMMLKIYIQNYNEYYRIFNAKYNLDNSYTNRRYFSTSIDLLSRLSISMTRDSFEKEIIDYVEEPCVYRWCKGIEPKNTKEHLCQQAILSKDYEGLCYLLYRNERMSLKCKMCCFLIKLLRKIF